jgi:hypothetical protein
VGLAHTACLAADALGYEAVRKSGVPSWPEIAARLPARVGRSAAVGEMEKRVEERFRQLDTSLAP